MKMLKIKLISPRAEKALNELASQKYIQIIDAKTNKPIVVEDPTPKEPLNFARETHEELLKKIRSKTMASVALENARKIIDDARNRNGKVNGQ